MVTKPTAFRLNEHDLAALEVHRQARHCATLTEAIRLLIHDNPERRAEAIRISAEAGVDVGEPVRRRLDGTYEPLRKPKPAYGSRLKKR